MLIKVQGRQRGSETFEMEEDQSPLSNQIIWRSETNGITDNQNPVLQKQDQGLLV